MTNTPAPPSYGSRLQFGSPLSEARCDRLVNDLAASRPATVLDIGCGWGEMLLRIVAATDGATGIGVDNDGPDIARGRANARQRGLADRVTFVEGLGGEHTDPADLVLCVGASQAFGDIPVALERLKSLVKPGGTLLFADAYFQRVPTAEELSNMWPDASADEYGNLAGLVDQTVDAGYLPLWIEVADQDEWDFFESGHRYDWAKWLLEHGDSAESAASIRAKLEQHHKNWLHGWRGVLGFAYLTLGVPAA